MFVLAYLGFTTLIVSLSGIFFSLVLLVILTLAPLPSGLASLIPSLDRCGSVVGDTSRESTAALARLFRKLAVMISGDIFTHPLLPSPGAGRVDGSFFSRTDLIGCPFTWVPSVSACDLVPFPFSDYCALVFSVSVPDVIPHWSRSVEAKCVHSEGEGVF